MKKLLFFILLCSLCSCSKETQEEQPKVSGGNFALSLYSTDSIYQSGIDSLLLFYFPESTNPVKPIYFQEELAWGEPIELQDLNPEPYTFITVACSGSLEDLKDHMNFYREYVSIEKHENTSENLFGGVLKQNPVSGEVKLELQRLVGGIKINIANLDSLKTLGNVSCYIANAPDCIYLGNTDNKAYIYTQYIPVDNAWHYIFPTDGTVKGTIEIEIYDQYNNYHPQIFEFSSENAVIANKKLELNFTLQQKAITKSGTSDWQLSLEEELTNL